MLALRLAAIASRIRCTSATSRLILLSEHRFIHPADAIAASQSINLDMQTPLLLD